MNYEEQLLSELEQLEDYISILDDKVRHIKKLIRNTQDENIKKYIPVIDTTYLNRELNKEEQHQLWRITDGIKTSILLKKLGYKAKYIKTDNEEWATLIITKEEDNIYV
ncbi:hypothetical protein [uncultured Clostridium sp.]|jgi:hypothetical protein|uniref:hypothetical protein n=1 Tax=uncultured Clostridium sp. TaxID=59620 RepID=UPI00321622E6